MEYWLGVATLVGIYMIAVLGVSILCGFTGMFSMGHAGFMAIGAYTSALLTKAFDVPIYFGILAGMLTASVVGAIVSYPTLKLRDDYFIIVTLGIGEAIKLIIQNATSITGGARGLADIPKGSNFVNVWIIVILTVIVLKSFINSRHGRNCIAVREEELAAQSVGVNVFKYKMEAMVISCALCGCSGALLGHYMHYLQPNMFTMVKSDELVIMVILRSGKSYGYHFSRAFASAASGASTFWFSRAVAHGALWIPCSSSYPVPPFWHYGYTGADTKRFQILF